MKQLRAAVLLGALLGGVATAAQAQSRATRLIDGARQQINDFNADSAFTLLQQALDAGSRPTAAERQRGQVLYGIVVLLRSNGTDRAGARQAFEAVLRADPTYALPDSLADLHGDARLAFAEARQVVPLPVAASPSLAVTLVLPADTSVPADGLLRVEGRPNFAARVVFSISPASAPGAVLWADTTPTGGGARTWNLRERDQVVRDGRYALRAFGADSAGRLSSIVERILVIGRVPVDTLAPPAPLTAAAFQPETLYLKRGSPSGLAAGLLIAAGAVVLPSALGNPDLQTGASYAGSYAVAGVVSVASIAGFLRGTRVRPLPENALHNQQLRERDASERARITQENANRRAAAPIRVRVEGVGP